MTCSSDRHSRMIAVLMSLFRRFIAAILLVAASPLILTAMLLIRIESGAGVIFRQKRIGKDKRVFTVYKLRTMASKPLAEKDALFPDKDTFITPLGKILRILKIDEVPQLFNIIKGQMGFLGPRPLREKLHRYYMEKIPGFEARYQVLPGITGLSQLIDPEDEDRSFGLACDLYYINHKSFKLDLVILAFTMLYVLYSIFKNAYSRAKRRFQQQVAGDLPSVCHFDSAQKSEAVLSLIRE